jgi:hypothetical protein
VPDLELGLDHEELGRSDAVAQRASADQPGDGEEFSRLSVSYPGGGGCGLMTVEIDPGIAIFDYDEATDTLLASDGLTWFRVLGGDTPPTQLPATEPPTTLAPAAFPAFAVTQPYECTLESGRTADASAASR